MRVTRKPISKSLRFEVFKRDSFKCQYCGASAPDALLHVDHIDPVSKGGANDIVNLITACQPCNLGKSNRSLDSNVAVQKSRDQMEELQARKEQLELMLAWKEDLQENNDRLLKSLAMHWECWTPSFSLSKDGLMLLRRMLRTYPYLEICEAMDIAAEQYLAMGDDTHPTRDSVELALSKIEGICRVNAASAENPHLRDMLYTRGILRNRLQYLNENILMELMQVAVDAGVSMEWIKLQATRASSWTNFKNRLYAALETDENG